MANSGKILITAGRGKTGSRIAKKLKERGNSVRTTFSRAPEPNDGNDHVFFNWYDESTHEAALKDVEKIYLLGPLGVLDQTKFEIPFIEKALKVGVKRIVLLSSASVPEDGPVMGAVHRYIHENVPEWAVLRPSYFMENFSEGPYSFEINGTGTLTTATGGGRIGFVSADDIAEVGVRTLIDEKPHNTAHIITGPQTLTYAEVGEIIGAVTGFPIKYVRTTSEELAKTFMSFGMDADYSRYLARLDDEIRLHGTEDQVTDTVLRITGLPPISLHDFAVANASCWPKK